MGKLKSSGKKKNGIVNLKIMAEKLQRSLLIIGKKSDTNFDEDFGEVSESTYVPKDVKEGHFAVLAVDGDEPKRFVAPLAYLTHPTFLRLLERAAEEYGFDHEGALTVPCKPSELERILADQKWPQEKKRDNSNIDVNWGSGKSMVQSY